MRLRMILTFLFRIFLTIRNGIFFQNRVGKSRLTAVGYGALASKFSRAGAEAASCRQQGNGGKQT